MEGEKVIILRENLKKYWGVMTLCPPLMMGQILVENDVFLLKMILKYAPLFM
jgi:hypothetical protein